jgi:hypothetical protein
MFIGDADMTCLRQGDILKNVPYPLLNTIEIRLLSSAPAEAWKPSEFRAHETNFRESPAWTCQSMVRICFAAVISQCCDIAPHHGKIPQQTIALARLIPIPRGPAKDVEKLASLMANKYPLDPDDPGYINFFYVPTQVLLDNKDWVVDYNQVLSIPATEFPAILGRKILQMNDYERIKFKIKLAASFGRLMEEEQALGHPWTRTENAGDNLAPNEPDVPMVEAADPPQNPPPPIA